jgi:hypothetical protein
LKLLSVPREGSVIGVARDSVFDALPPPFQDGTDTEKLKSLLLFTSAMPVSPEQEQNSETMKKTNNIEFWPDRFLFCSDLFDIRP